MALPKAPKAQSADAFLDASLAVKPKKPRKLGTATKAKKAKGTPRGKAPVERLRGSLAAPVTQKARGVMQLASRLSEDSGIGRMGMYGPPGPIALLPYAMPGHWPKSKQLFARPCPLTPRHGFVDSRPVNSFDEALDVYIEAREADPSAEMLLMPRASGEYSAILTHAGVTWGFGNDGATGKAGGLTLPTSTTPAIFHEHFAKRVLASWNHKETMQEAGIKSAAYIEIVEADRRACVVQLRDGPEQVTTKDYIPRPVKVRSVFKLEGEPDLLGWEALVKGFAGVDGQVVWYPGGTLSSHYSVHCVAAGVPVVTTYEPLIGDTILPPKGGPVPPTADDWRYCSKCVEYWASADLDVCGVVPSFASLFSSDQHGRRHMLALSSVGILHSQSIWGGEPHLMQLRAYSAVVMAKLVAAACLGEGRHWFGAGPGNKRSLPRPMEWIAQGLDKPPKVMQSEKNRSIVYCHALAEPLERLHPLMCQQEAEFLTIGWGTPRYNVYGRLVGEEPDYGYGGPRWAECAAEGRELIGALLAFLAKPDVDTWARVLMRQNNLLHVAHNGGALLNKFIATDFLDVLAMAPGLGLANTLVGSITLGLNKESPMPPKAKLPTFTVEEARKLKRSLWTAKAPFFPLADSLMHRRMAAQNLAYKKKKQAQAKAAKLKAETAALVSANVAKAQAAHEATCAALGIPFAKDMGAQHAYHAYHYYKKGPKPDSKTKMDYKLASINAKETIN